MKLEQEDVYNPNKPEPKDVRTGDAVFTLRGSHDYMYDDIPATNRKDTSGHACAKKTGSNYFIRMNNRGEIFNPLEQNHINTAGRMYNNLPVWRYVKVTYTTFAHYAHFLKTRNLAFLTLTRRDMAG